MGKRKAAKAQRHQNDIDELISHEQKSLEQVDKIISSAERIADPSEKILKLQELDRSLLGNRWYFFKCKFLDIRDQYVEDINLFKKLYHSINYDFDDVKAEKECQLKEKNPGIMGVYEAINKREARIEAALDETIRSCHGHLAEVADSPFFSKARSEYLPLRDLFDAAKAAREALGDKAPASQRLTPVRPDKNTP